MAGEPPADKLQNIHFGLHLKKNMEYQNLSFHSSVIKQFPHSIALYYVPVMGIPGSIEAAANEIILS
jgi:hypothetical protein